MGRGKLTTDFTGWHGLLFGNGKGNFGTDYTDLTDYFREGNSILSLTRFLIVSKSLSLWILIWFVVSRSRIVTIPDSSESWSTVMQYGVPISSARAYLFPIEPDLSKVEMMSFSTRSLWIVLAKFWNSGLLIRGKTEALIGDNFFGSFRTISPFSFFVYASQRTARRCLPIPKEGSITCGRSFSPVVSSKYSSFEPECA